MNLEEKTVSNKVVFQGHILRVHCDDALRADGKPCTREYIEHPGGACVLFVREGKRGDVVWCRVPAWVERLPERGRAATHAAVSSWLASLRWAA